MGRHITVTVGPLVAGDPDVISTLQTPLARAIAINGALTDGGTANNIAQSQTPAGAGNLTLNGTLVSGGVAYLGTNRHIYITSAGDDSGDTFTITGLFQTAQGLVSQVESIAGANTSIAATTKTFYSISQIAVSGATAAAITVGRGGVATLDVARRVIITSGADDTDVTFTITGTNASGLSQVETLVGASGAAAQSALDFKTVISVVPSAAVATTVTVGTNGVASSPWVRFDDYAAHAEVAIQATVTGTANGTIQQTMQDTDPASPVDKVAPDDITWVNHPDAALVAFTTTVQGNYAYSPIFARVVLNSGTGSISTGFRQVFLGH